jgi:hypothetical protein
MRRKSRIASFRTVSHKQIDDLFKVKESKKKDFVVLFKFYLVGYSTNRNSI